MTLHILKPAAGIGTIEQLKHVISRYSYDDPDLGHIMHMSSRNTPRRADELLNGGSVFWIIKRAIVARAPLVAIREDERRDGRKGCQMCIRPEVILTVPQPKRSFQGWRYLKAEEAPADLTNGQDGVGNGSAELAKELQMLGLL